MRRLRNSRLFRAIAVFVTFSMFWQMIFPAVAYGLTSGPSQPEMQGFEPIGTTDMVDLFSGDFKYNIPLLDVGGYPINMVYNSGITMDQEASWVGLGWSLNPGAINRNLRGVPDDFNGDKVEEEVKMLDNTTLGLTVGGTVQLIGIDGLSVSGNFGVSYNNHKGLGIDLSVTPMLEVGGLNASASFSGSSQSGVSLSPSLSYSAQLNKKTGGEGVLGGKGSLGFSASYNTRAGLSQVSFNASIQNSFDKVLSKGQSSALNKATSFSGGAAITFGPSYFPVSQYSMENANVRFQADAGTQVLPAHPGLQLSGYVSNQTLSQEGKFSRKAYGYHYLSNKHINQNSIVDYNTEKDNNFSENSKNVYLASHTNDMFSVTGQGLVGSFQGYRSDVGYGFDPGTRNVSRSTDVGLEVGIGNLAHAGGSVVNSATTSTNGNWSDNNYAGVSLQRVNRDDISNKEEKALFQQVVYKFSGELHVKQDMYSGWGGYDPVTLDVRDIGNYKVKLKNEYLDYKGNQFAINKNYHTDRHGLKKQVQVLTAKEADMYGFDKSINSYTVNDIISGNPPVVLGQGPSYRKPNHFSEFRITDEQGWTYVYGIPAYNVKQYEVSFSTVGSDNCETGLVTYVNGENSDQNESGTDQFYSKRSIPPYVHSWLLTAILPPDYRDLDNNGISDVDLGNGIQFKYEKLPNLYRWRTPMGGSNVANFNPGYNSKELDNKGNYVYGEKELWYLTAIESKTHVALFYTSGRHDALGASGEDGGICSICVQNKLDSIKLFSRSDFEANGISAEPIKSVYFVYDYELCPSIPNTSVPNEGKLTLKELYFSYGRSHKAKLNRYEFHYSFNNPGYNLRGSDRWGSYKKPVFNNECANDEIPSNIDFPYTPQAVIKPGEEGYDSEFQESTVADYNATAWNLTSIDLPSGGTINISYEADDYAFVQNKRAMRMFKIKGLGSSTTFTSINQLYDANTTNDVIFFALDETYPSAPSNEVYNRYFKGVDTLYFKLFTNILHDDNNDDHYEYVTGYAPVAEKGFVKSSGQSDYDYGYIRLKKIGIKDGNKGDQISPLLKAALQYSRLHMSELVYPGSDPKATGESALRGLVSLVFDVMSIFGGFNNMLMTRNFCQTIAKGSSFIRLNDPNLMKQGGGSRVKSITINDNWEDMVGIGNGESTQYGQEYDYTATYELEGDEIQISSGVASYEPMIGNDENPFRMPVAVTIEHAMAPDDENYIEKPFGEMFFPSPSVGYSKVTVRNLQYEDVKRTATGWTVNEFFTAKDFPTRISYTPMQLEDKHLSSLAKFFSKSDRKLLAATQGYSIILNDMHGRPKANFTYSESGEVVSGTEYKYKRDPNHPSRLDNTVKLIKPGDGALEEVEKEFGVEVDIVNHFKSSDLIIDELDAQANLDAFVVVIPVPIPSLHFPLGHTEHAYRLASTTKVIQQHGLVEEVVAHDFGSSISTKNLAYDYYTGEVLVTETYNEYEDPVYNMTYPGYWAYSGLGPASLNTDIVVDVPDGISSSGVATIDDEIVKHLEHGDELMVYGSGGSLELEPLWLGEIANVQGSTDDITLIDRFGNTRQRDKVSLRVWNSGKVNTPTLPVQTHTSFTNPLDANTFSTDPKIINSEASTYSDYWQMHTYNCETEYESCSCDTAETLIKDIQRLINYLCQGTQIFDPTYHYSGGQQLQLTGLDAYSQRLADLHPSPYTHYWTNSVSSTSNAYGFIGSDGQTECGFNFVLDNGYYLGSVTDWTNLKEVILLGPSLTNEDCDPAYYNIKGLAEFEERNVQQVGDQYITYDVESYAIPFTLVQVNNCYPIVSCYETTGTVGLINPGDNLNPYLYGILGNWQKKQSFTYQTDRDYSTQTIRKDGVFGAYDPYWVYDNGKLDVGTVSNWVFPTKVTKRSPHGFEVENEDILGLYSSARFGYSYTLPTDIAQNAQYREAGFESFEDVNFLGDECIPRHLGFIPGYETTEPYLKTDFAHTGLYSMEIEASGNAFYMVKVEIPTCPDQVAPGIPYTVDQCDMLPSFMPGSKTEGTQYVMSLWYYYDQPNQVPDYDQPSLMVTYDGNPCTTQVLSISPLIERWQKVDFLVDIPTVVDDKFIYVSIGNNSSIQSMYLDDIRAFPFNGTMKSYVYNPVTLRLMAELDENNYATLYEYDKEGILIRVKKETEKGIMTIQETRQHKSLK